MVILNVISYNNKNSIIKRAFGNVYAIKNKVTAKTKVDIRDLIDIINFTSVFLLSCKGYVIIENNNVTPYINCNDVIYTNGYNEF